MKTITRILSFLFTLLLLSGLLMTVTVSADDAHSALLVDDADLMTPGQEEAMLQRMKELVEQYGINIAIVTTRDLNGKSPEAYADDYYDDRFGINTDGFLLLRYKNEYDKYVHLSTSGVGISILTDYDIDLIFDRMQPYCDSGNDAAAFNVFIDALGPEIDDFYAYDKIWIFVGLALGLIIALIVTGRMKSELKTVNTQKYAGSYIREDSLNMTVSRDTFLYSTISRVRRETSSSSSGGGSSTHHSSSGGTHGGGGRHM